MKRHQQLQPLSRQHHNGLLMALLIKKGLTKKAAVVIINDFIVKGWEEELRDHFEMEETVLLPALRNKPVDPLLIEQLLAEHAKIRSLVTMAEANKTTAEDLQLFSSILEKHIRFEEKQFFPMAEEALSEEELLTLGSQLHEDLSRSCINYPQKFWE
jgi:hemerythrin-like domain-containing protein